jgi:hypothetical protein
VLHTQFSLDHFTNVEENNPHKLSYSYIPREREMYEDLVIDD